MQRREFLKKSAGALALAAWAAPAFAAEEASPAGSGANRPIHKAIMWGTVGVKGSLGEQMKNIKEAGFGGVGRNSNMNQEGVHRASGDDRSVCPCLSTPE